MTAPGGTERFGCGHPRAGNTLVTNRLNKNGSPVTRCVFCDRVRRVCRSAERTQRRINEDRLTRGERIAGRIG